MDPVANFGLVRPPIVYLGSVGPNRRAEVLGSAAALLHPVHFREPFGLSVVESMMCGTPVVAYDRGAMAEIVDDGLTGCLVSDVRESTEAVERAVNIDRAECRRTAERRFSADRMVDDYIRVYETVLAGETAPA